MRHAGFELPDGRMNRNFSVHSLFFFNHSSIGSNHAIYCSSVMGPDRIITRTGSGPGSATWWCLTNTFYLVQRPLASPLTEADRCFLPSLTWAAANVIQKNFLLTFFTLCRVNMMHILLPAALGTGLACRLTNKECLLTLQRLVFDGNIWTNMLVLPEKVFYSNSHVFE